MAIQSGQLASIATNCTAIINERMPEANLLAAIIATDAEAEALLTMPASTTSRHTATDKPRRRGKSR